MAGARGTRSSSGERRGRANEAAKPAPQPTGFDEFRGGDRGSYVDYSYSPASQSPDRSVEGLAQHLAALEARAAAEELIELYEDALVAGIDADSHRLRTEVSICLANLASGDGGAAREAILSAGGEEAVDGFVGIHPNAHPEGTRSGS